MVIYQELRPLYGELRLKEVKTNEDKTRMNYLKVIIRKLELKLGV